MGPGGSHWLQARGGGLSPSIHLFSWLPPNYRMTLDRLGPSLLFDCRGLPRQPPTSPTVNPPLSIPKRPCERA